MRHHIMQPHGRTWAGFDRLTVVLGPPPKVASPDNVLCEEADYRPWDVIQRTRGRYPACAVDNHRNADDRESIR